MKLLYFAWIRQRVGCSEEDVQLPGDVRTASELVRWLVSRDVRFADVLGDLSRIKIAINQEHAGLNSPVSNSDEVAFFPPVTGG